MNTQSINYLVKRFVFSLSVFILRGVERESREDKNNSSAEQETRMTILVYLRGALS